MSCSVTKGNLSILCSTATYLLSKMDPRTKCTKELSSSWCCCERLLVCSKRYISNFTKPREPLSSHRKEHSCALLLLSRQVRLSSLIHEEEKVVLRASSSPRSSCCAHSISNAASTPSLRRGAWFWDSLLKAVATLEDVTPFLLRNYGAGSRRWANIVRLSQGACLHRRSLVLPVVRCSISRRSNG